MVTYYCLLTVGLEPCNRPYVVSPANTPKKTRKPNAGIFLFTSVESLSTASVSLLPAEGACTSRLASLTIAPDGSNSPAISWHSSPGLGCQSNTQVWVSEPGIEALSFNSSEVSAPHLASRRASSVVLLAVPLFCAVRLNRYSLVKAKESASSLVMDRLMLAAVSGSILNSAHRKSPGTFQVSATEDPTNPFR